jgi:hypothetical protein
MTDDTWVPLSTCMATLEHDPAYRGFMNIVTVFSTRRTVTVTTRKYKARRHRRR